MRKDKIYALFGVNDADAELGDTALSAIGLDQFEHKESAYQSMSDRICFTYAFKCGLVNNTTKEI